MRFTVKWAVGLLALAMPFAIVAQNVPAPAGWTYSVGQNVDTYVKGSQSAPAAAVMATNVNVRTAADAWPIAHKVMAALQCPTPIPSHSNGVIGPFGSGPICYAVLNTTTNGFRLSVGMAKSQNDKTGMMSLTKSLVGPVATRTTPPVAPSGQKGAGQSRDPAKATTAIDPAAMLANIPANRRPVHADFSKNDPARYYFPTGYATPCDDFDPGLVEPTPAGFKKAGLDCDAYPWRASGGGIEYQQDGKWYKTSLPDDTIIPFKTGQRLDLNWGNVSTHSFGGVGGPINTSTMSGDQIILKKDGTFIMGSWSSTNISVTGAVGGSSTDTGPVRGRYALSGHLIAIVTDGGQSYRGFATGVGLNGRIDHLYINGRHYWQPD
jgi:hypothetical protein